MGCGGTTNGAGNGIVALGPRCDLLDGSLREGFGTFGKVLFETVITAVKTARHDDGLPEVMDGDTSLLKAFEFASEGGCEGCDSLGGLLEAVEYTDGDGE